MSNKIQGDPSMNRLSAFRAWLSRWGVPGARMSPVEADLLSEGRRPGAAQPVYLEVSPATADPFPEPRTIPRGWDLSELSKSR